MPKQFVEISVWCRIIFYFVCKFKSSWLQYAIYSNTAKESLLNIASCKISTSCFYIRRTIRIQKLKNCQKILAVLNILFPSCVIKLSFQQTSFQTCRVLHLVRELYVNIFWTQEQHCCRKCLRNRPLQT